MVTLTAADYDGKGGSILRTIWAALNALLWLPVCGGLSILCVVLIPVLGLTAAQRLMWRCACVYFRLVLWASGVSYTVVGLERLDPSAHYFFACNHRSDYDIPLAFAALPFWLISIAKSSIACIPVFGWAVALAGSVFIDRADHRRAVGALDRARDDLVARPRSAAPDRTRAHAPRRTHGGLEDRPSCEEGSGGAG
jgi:lysophosphatidate acyltransferase